MHISIHASRGGSDGDSETDYISYAHFNPRFPRGKRLNDFINWEFLHHISIHASRGGSDEISFTLTVFAFISIHASRGGSDRALHTVI